MTIPKAVVAFNGARDAYQLPLALQEGQMLARFMTELYFPVDQSWFKATLGRVLPSSAVRARSQPLMNSRDVRLLPRLLTISSLASARPQSLNALNHLGNIVVGQALRRYAARHGCAIFSYSYYAQHAFLPPWDAVPFRFLFQVHPQASTAIALLREEIERTPEGKASLLHEYELSLSAAEVEGFTREAQWSNGWVVASSYTASTLEAQGVPRDRIHIIPYGVDHARFPARKKAPDPSQPLTLIFIGTLGQRKGLADLLAAVRLLNTRHIRLLVCGRGFVDTALLDAYRDVPFEHFVNLPHAQLLEKLWASDAFVLPTLLEGFGHVILESMSSGVPVITTPHSAAPDLYTDGQEGFIEPIRAPERLAERLAWCLDHRDELAVMGQRAAERARLFTWARFRAGIREAYRTMIDAVQGEVSGGAGKLSP